MNSSKPITSLFLDKKYRVLRHIMFWLYIYIDEVLSFTGLTPPLDDVMIIFLGMLMDMVVVYFNLYFLIPKFLMKKKFFVYILLSGLSLVFILGFNIYMYEFEMDEYFLSDTIVNMLYNSFMLGLAVALKLVKIIYDTKIENEKLSTESLKTELGFLKNQVNPHFLFNTMNSFYVQAKKKDDKLPDAILNLSDLLRYQIYDTQKEMVNLNDEVKYIRNYMDLEKNRRDNLLVHVNFQNQNHTAKIAPLLFLPLVENAVKYSQRTDGGKSSIDLEVLANSDKIQFQIKNSKGDIENIKSPDSGIGLNNVRKRLDLLYKNDYVFDVNDEQDFYEATITIRLK